MNGSGNVGACYFKQLDAKPCFSFPYMSVWPFLKTVLAQLDKLELELNSGYSRITRYHKHPYQMLYIRELRVSELMNTRNIFTVIVFRNILLLHCD